MWVEPVATTKISPFPTSKRILYCRFVGPTRLRYARENTALVITWRETNKVSNNLIRLYYMTLYIFA